MASIRQSIRSSTTSKRPTSAIADGQIALNTASGEPGLFFKDNANNIIKTGPAHYGASAPNVSPAVGGSAGNSLGEAWLDSALTPPGWKIWSGTAWVNATPLSSDTVQGLVELATNAETQAGVDTARAVTSASLQSKVSDSISTASASGIASSSAVKTAYDLANAALPKSGGIITGNLEIGSTGSLTFEGSTADGFETTLAVVDPTVDRTITFPNITGTVVTTGDSGTVTSTMIADGTIVNADVSTSAAIAFSKLASLASANILVGSASGVATSTVVSGDVTITNAGVTSITSNVIVNADINSAAAIAYSKLALSSGITNTDISASAAVAYSKLALSNSIVNADINSAAAIAGTKISPDFGSQNLTTTGNITAANHITASGTATSAGVQVGTGATYKPGIYSPGADQLAISTSGTGRLFVDASGNVGVGVTPVGGTASYKSIEAGARGCGFLANTNGLDFYTTSNSYFDGAWKYGANGFATRLDLLNGVYSFNTAPLNSGGAGAAATFTERLRITSTGAMNFVGAGTAGSTQAVSFNGSAPVNSLVIDSSGRLGIGTSSPSENLTVYGTSSRLAVTGGAGSSAILLGNQNGSGANNPSVIEAANGALYFGGGNSWSGGGTFDYTMTLTNDNKVGIGTTSPAQALSVVGNIIADGSAASQYVASSKAGVTSTYLITDANGGNIQTDGAWPIRFTINSAERARIDSSGRLLVGTSSARANFFNGSNSPGVQVEGTTATGRWLGVTSSSSNALDPGVITLAHQKSGTIGGNTLVANNDRLGLLSFQGSDGSDFVEAALIICEVDGTPGANDMPGRLVFSTTADGAASPTERMRIDSTGLMTLAGPGIKFPATQVASTDPNTLDDYEEGTWTPVFTLGGSVTYTTQQGRYTKVGRLVTISVNIIINTVSSPTSSLEINLPFAPAISNESCVCRTGGCVSTLGTMVVDTVTTNARLFGVDALNVISNPADKLAAGCQVRFVLSYTT